eukprot:1809647-Pleurochrysis_carterae.AAC.1
MGCMKRVVILEEGPDDETSHPSIIGNIRPYALTPQLNVFFQFAASDITRNMFSEPVWEYDRGANSSGFIAEKHNFMLNALDELPEGWERKSFEHTAKILGGNTMHNYQIYIRPGREGLSKFGEDWDVDMLMGKSTVIEDKYLKLPTGFNFNNTIVSEFLYGRPDGPESELLRATIAGGAQA